MGMVRPQGACKTRRHYKHAYRLQVGSNPTRAAVGGKGDKMKAMTILVGLSFWLVAGCSSLIVRYGDDPLVTTGKVSTRVVLGLATVGISEIAVQHRKNEEACDAQRGHWFFGGCH